MEKRHRQELSGGPSYCWTCQEQALARGGQVDAHGSQERGISAEPSCSGCACKGGCKVSARRAGAVAGVPRARCRDQSQARDQTALRRRLRDLAGARVRYGYRRLDARAES